MSTVSSDGTQFPSWPAWAIEHEEDLEAYIGIEPEMDERQILWELASWALEMVRARDDINFKLDTAAIALTSEHQRARMKR